MTSTRHLHFILLSTTTTTRVNAGYPLPPPPTVLSCPGNLHPLTKTFAVFLWIIYDWEIADCCLLHQYSISTIQQIASILPSTIDTWNFNICMNKELRCINWWHRYYHKHSDDILYFTQDKFYDTMIAMSKFWSATPHHQYKGVAKQNPHRCHCCNHLPTFVLHTPTGIHFRFLSILLRLAIHFNLLLYPINYSNKMTRRSHLSPTYLPNGLGTNLPHTLPLTQPTTSVYLTTV